MARNEIVIAAAREEVFDELIDPGNFGYWVVGTKYVRGADEDWPEVGSMFHHSLGFGPVHIADQTEVLQIEGPERVLMRAFIGVLGTASVRLFLEPADGGTRVAMEEEPEGGLLTWLPQPVADALAHRRNERSLKRLKRLVEGEEDASDLDASTPLSLSAGRGRRTTPGRLLAAAAANALVLAGAAALWRRKRRQMSSGRLR